MWGQGQGQMSELCFSTLPSTLEQGFLKFMVGSLIYLFTHYASTPKGFNTCCRKGHVRKTSSWLAK